VPEPVLLSSGKIVALDAVAVMRTVSADESQRFNDRGATLPSGASVVSDR
jgi:hypothetical protein